MGLSPLLNRSTKLWVCGCASATLTGTQMIFWRWPLKGQSGSLGDHFLAATVAWGKLHSGSSFIFMTLQSKVSGHYGLVRRAVLCTVGNQLHPWTWPRPRPGTLSPIPRLWHGQRHITLLNASLKSKSPSLQATATKIRSTWQMEKLTHKSVFHLYPERRPTLYSLSTWIIFVPSLSR